MADNMAKNFASDDFNPEKFVKDLSAQCVGADELRKQRAKIQELADNTSAQLKKNVYQNYMQFIETAKEISHLESEMYQLSQLLSEQRSLLSTLGSTRAMGVTFEELTESCQENSNDPVSKEEEQKQKLVKLLENVEGAMKEWLDKCEQAKKAKLAQDNHVEPSDKTDQSKENCAAPSRSMSLDSNTLGMEDSEDSEHYEIPSEWVLEVAEDLDSCIAQRHFEEAYSLLEKARGYIRDTQQTPFISEIQVKINDRNRSLIDVLTKELEFSAEAKSIQGGGLRSARRIVRLLIQLNRSAQACHLYLRFCSAVLKARLKRIKKEGATVSYVSQLSAIAFSNIVEMSREFLKLFPQSTNCTSGLVVWCSQEVKHLTTYLVKQLFHPQVSLHVLVKSIRAVRCHCDQLTQLGMDFRYQLDGQLRTPVIKAVQETANNYIENIKNNKDSWEPSNFTSQNHSKLLSEFNELGIGIPRSYVANDYWISLTNNLLQFSKFYITFTMDCLSVVTPELMTVIEDTLVNVMQTEISFLTTSIANTFLGRKRDFMLDNAEYVRSVVLDQALELYKSVTNKKFHKLIILKEQINFESV
ncbi:exocyst complex component 8 isoform X2 [Prorops nasuta]|uniref:exocyst complex component 8 isoform X2 n=1 Tax=Prorops nasuta TaxID=863751 RepID=UPI0034CECBC5